MPCPAVSTGNQFLVESLAHLDCQAQTLGSFGFQALAAPGSPGAVVLTALLTLFVALYGIRLLFSPGDEPRDLVTAVLKVGIVLTIAVSWPAWRTLAYDTVLHGPTEVASAMMPETLPDPTAQLPQRLQGIDNGIAALTALNTGRQTGQIIAEGPASGFGQIALEDEAGLGWSRPIYLASTIGSLAVLRVAGGLLLALAPLVAGLLLFDPTRGLFAGWLRALVLVALGSLAQTVLLSVQLALMEPWLADTLGRRALGYATPTAPTELLALVAAFALATAGLLFIVAKVAFQHAGAQRDVVMRIIHSAREGARVAAQAGRLAEIPVHSRAAAISESVAAAIRREDLQAEGFDRGRRIGYARPDARALPAGATPSPEPLGSAYRRTAPRDTASHRQRDRRA